MRRGESCGQWLTATVDGAAWQADPLPSPSSTPDEANNREGEGVPAEIGPRELYQPGRRGPERVVVAAGAFETKGLKR